MDAFGEKDYHFFPEADPELGILKSDLAEYQYSYQFRRYGYIADILKSNTVQLDSICDYGSGSGFGTSVLRANYGSVVYGVEINDRALAYARKHYPDVIFKEESHPHNDVTVFCEVIQRMTMSELREQVNKSDVCIFSFPVSDGHIIMPDATPGMTMDRFDSVMSKHDMMQVYAMLDGDRKFAEGYVGMQYVGLYANPEVMD